MKPPGGEAGRTPALVRNRRQLDDQVGRTAASRDTAPGFDESRPSRTAARTRSPESGPSLRCSRARPGSAGRMIHIRHRSPVAVEVDPARRDPPRGGSATDPAALRRHVRRLGRAAMVVAAGSAALALAGPFALRPFVDAAGAAGSGGDVVVAFVLDFGGSHADQVVGCVDVPSTDSDYDALSAFATQEHLALPTYNPSGLLCSINGVPSAGCGEVVPKGYIYWSYFTLDAPTTQWEYAKAGAFATVHPGDVEGWRFQDPGTGLPDDPPPRTAPVLGTICAAGSPTTTTTTTTTTPVASTPSTPTTAAVPGTAAGSGGGSGTSPAPSRPSRGHHGAVAAGGGARVGRTTVTTAPPTTDPGSTSTTGTTPPISLPADPDAGLAAVGRPSAPGPGADPMIIGGLLVAGLAVAAFELWRRRSRTP